MLRLNFIVSLAAAVFAFIAYGRGYELPGQLVAASFAGWLVMPFHYSHRFARLVTGGNVDPNLVFFFGAAVGSGALTAAYFLSGNAGGGLTTLDPIVGVMAIFAACCLGAAAFDVKTAYGMSLPLAFFAALPGIGLLAGLKRRFATA